MSRYYDTLDLADSLRINNTTVIDSSRNLTNIGTISKTLVTASEGREIESYMPSSYGINSIVSGHRYGWYNDNWYIGMCRSGNTAGEDFGFDYNGVRKFGVTNTGQVEVNGTAVIDSSRNLSGKKITLRDTGTHDLTISTRANYVNDTANSHIWGSDATTFKTGEGAHLVFEGRKSNRDFYFKVGDVETAQHVFHHNGFVGFGIGDSTIPTDRVHVSGNVRSDAYKIGTTTVIDSSRNLTNIGTVSTSSTITCGGEVNASGDIYAGGGQVYVNSGNADVKLGLWGNNSTTYGIGMTSGVTYGGLNDYAMTFCMNNESDRGFWWGYSGQSKSVGAMSLTTAGVLTVAGTITTGTNGNISTGTGGSISAFSNVTASNGFVKSGSGGFYVSSTQIVDANRNLTNIGSGTFGGNIDINTNTENAIDIYESSGGSGFTYMRFLNTTGSTMYGRIYRSYSSLVYSTSSDYRLKENVVDLTNASDRIKLIPVRRFNFIEHPDRTVDGFLAHEVQAVVPEAIIGEKDEVDDKGSPVYQGIDQSKLVPLLTAALQEALQEIENLKTRVSALEK